MEIREVDLAAVLAAPGDPEAVGAAAAAVNKAFARHGFLLVRNHGLPGPQIEALRTAAEGFFLRTPQAAKSACCDRRAPVPRGYSGSQKENFAILAGKRLPNDLVEKYRMGPWRQDPADPYVTATKDAQLLFYPNRWPVDDTWGLQRAMEDYYGAVERLAGVLMRVFARCLDLPPGFFEDKLDRHTSILSVNHYPPITRQVQRGQLRLAEHTDVDLFTILWPDWDDRAGCLEAQDPESGAWAPVPIVPETLVVNIGDGLRHWTAGRWRSTNHRVAIPQDRAARASSRFAVGYFVGANYDAVLTRMPHVMGDYDECTYVEWRKARVQEAMKALASKDE